MVNADKTSGALYALHLILVRARFMAQTGEALKDIAVLLDYAEMLPRLLADEQDMTVTYREYVVAITERFPYCQYVLTQFDDPEPVLSW